MPAPYIPPKDALFDNWIANFSSMITASPATYGLLASDATTIATQKTAWAAAYASAVNPSTRTPTTVQAKNVAKANALATCRPYAQLIANNAGVSSSNKIALGLNPRNNPPTPVTSPTTNPVLSVPSMINLGHVIRYKDSLAAPSVSAKPAGAIAMQLYGTTSATAITDPTTLTYLGQVTKTPTLQTWPPAAAGKQAYYAGRWVTRKGLVGPWSAIVNATVPG